MTRLLPALAAAALAAGLVPSAQAASLSSLDSDELGSSYSFLAGEFYKKIDPQVILDGARDGMIAYLAKNGEKATLPPLRAGASSAANVRALQHEVSLAVSQYGRKLGSRDIAYSAIAGLLASVKDKYTVFLDPKEFAALNEGLDGKEFSGVGISIGIDDASKLLTVNDVIPDGPAEKAGLQPGDTILAIDGKTTKGLTVEEDSKLLRGSKGSIVKLSVTRGDATLDPIAVTRDTIHQPSVYAKLLPGDIGYARLTVFGLTTAEELTKALTRLQSEGAKAYVLDLRDNGGGYLNSAIDVSSKFIATGPIVSVESHGSDTQYDAENTAIPPKPLAVLVNKYTASASEITSGALQDDGVGELIGEKTYGKGVVQTIHPLPDGSAVKITTARYLTPHGRDINLVGINPDIVNVEPKTARLGDIKTDTQLQAAITYLEGRLAQTAASPS